MASAITSREDIAWAGGLFEGEGSFYIVRWKDGSHSPRAVAKVSMTDLDSVERFARSVGIGKARGPYGDKRTANRKPLYTWEVTGLEKVQAVVAMLWPFLGERRKATARVVLGLDESRSASVAQRARRQRERTVINNG